MLEELLGKKVVVVSTESHIEHKYLDAHYVGTLESAHQGEIKLSDWNDHLFRCFNDCRVEYVLDTRPTDRSKEVVIPREKVRHIYLLDKSKLNRGNDGLKKYIFRLWPSD